MQKVRNTILHFRGQHSSLHRLTDVGGASPSRSPPPDDLIDELRARVARKLGLDSVSTQAHHPASPWRFNIVKRVMTMAKDPDVEVPKWSEHGTPCGHRGPDSF